MSQMLHDYKIDEKGDIQTLTKAIESLPDFTAFTKAVTPAQKNSYEQIEVVENLMRVLFCNESPEALMKAFIDVAMQSGLNLDTLYSTSAKTSSINSGKTMATKRETISKYGTKKKIMW